MKTLTKLLMIGLLILECLTLKAQTTNTDTLEYKIILIEQSGFSKITYNVRYEDNKDTLLWYPDSTSSIEIGVKLQPKYSSVIAALKIYTSKGWQVDQLTYEPMNYVFILRKKLCGSYK